MQTRVIIQLRRGALRRLDLPAAEKLLLNELTRRLNSLVGSSHTFVGSLVQTERSFGARMRKFPFVHTHTRTHTLLLAACRWRTGRSKVSHTCVVVSTSQKGPLGCSRALLLWDAFFFFFLAAALKVSGGCLLARGLQLVFAGRPEGRGGGRALASVGRTNPGSFLWIRRDFRTVVNVWAAVL